MAFRPLGDRVLVKRVEEESKTKGGIIIPDTAKEKPQEGEVISVGPGVTRGIIYCADEPEPVVQFFHPDRCSMVLTRKTPSIHMPRWASRRS